MKPPRLAGVDPAVQAPMSHTQRRRHDSDAVTSAAPNLPVLDGLFLQGRGVAPSQSTAAPILARRGSTELNQSLIQHKRALGDFEWDETVHHGHEDEQRKITP